MTVVAAAEIISDFKSHSEMEILEVQWGIAGRCSASSKPARAASLAKIAIEEAVQVMTEQGNLLLERALVNEAIKAPSSQQKSDAWKKLVAGLRFDGFELVDIEIESDHIDSMFSGRKKKRMTLVRMLPNDLPGLDFREAESEIVTLLDRSGFTTAKGHLGLALAAFQRGEWASANGQLRNFYESYLNEIAVALGCPIGDDSKVKRDYLGTLPKPFLLSDYNEWNTNNQKPQYVQGLMSRMHPHGGHPGLSEEEDATFRLQISLVTARLFLRRFSRQNEL
ncbi:hypothetical protein [Polymorphobacter multimanifer]|uniref:Uncharacterized protein n=1 Tax=Polymorphobacter multimanifer TaxID=1070431 RepID=A0A841LAE8_9SPHN|nr:hypothetical protein [Polymorphobacter multimanifer]MBB6229410.1 hypothetical protein [Polymorphobacter multimanifer]